MAAYPYPDADAADQDEEPTGEAPAAENTRHALLRALHPEGTERGGLYL